MAHDLERFTRLLAEVLDDCRRNREPQREPATAPAVVSRMIAAARVLVAHGAGSQQTDLLRWSRRLLDLLLWVRRHPNRVPERLDRCWPLLDRYLEELIRRYDQGPPAMDLEHDPRFTTLLDCCEAVVAGSDGVVADLPATLDRLALLFAGRLRPESAERRGQPDPPGDDDAERRRLRRRWRRLRAAGDVFFGPDVVSRDRPTAQSAPQVLLLLSGSLRNDTLGQQLRQAGIQVTDVADARQACSLLRAEESAGTVLCDDVEPTRHARRLLALWNESGEDRAPPDVVLVSAARAESVRRRARELGLAGVWTSPFALTDLLPLL